MLTKKRIKKTIFWSQNITVIALLSLLGVLNACSDFEQLFPISSEEDLTTMQGRNRGLENALETEGTPFTESLISPLDNKDIQDDLRLFSRAQQTLLQTETLLNRPQKILHIDDTTINLEQNTVQVTFSNPQEDIPNPSIFTLTSHIHPNNQLGLARLSEWTKLSNYSSLYYRNRSNAAPTASLNYLEYHALGYINITQQANEEVVRIHMIFHQPDISSYTSTSPHPLADYTYDIGYGIWHLPVNITRDLPTGSASYSGAFFGQQKMEVQTENLSVLDESVEVDGVTFSEGTTVLQGTTVFARETNVPAITFEVDFSQEDFKFRIENTEMSAIRKISTTQDRERTTYLFVREIQPITGTISLEEIVGEGTIEEGELIGRLVSVRGYVDIQDFILRRRIIFDEFSSTPTLKASFYRGSNFSDIASDPVAALAGTLYGSAIHPIGDYTLRYHINGVFLAEKE